MWPNIVMGLCFAQARSVDLCPAPKPTKFRARLDDARDEQLWQEQSRSEGPPQFLRQFSQSMSGGSVTLSSSGPFAKPYLMDKNRSNRKSRDDREKDRDSGKDHRRRDRDRYHERDHKHRHHHAEGKRHGSRDERNFEDDRRHRSRDDSPSDLESRREEKRHGSRDERHRDDNRRHRSREDSPADLERRRERSTSRARDSVERDGASVERRHHSSSSRKRKEHEGDEEEWDKKGKRVRVSDGPREEKRERRRFEDRAGEDSSDLNGVYKAERKEVTVSKDGMKEGGLRAVEDDGEESRMKEEVMSHAEVKKPRKEGRRFSDGVKAGEKKDEDEPEAFDNKEVGEERRFKDRAKEENMGTVDEAKTSVSAANPTHESGNTQVVNGDQSSMEMKKRGSAANRFHGALRRICCSVPAYSNLSFEMGLGE